MCLLVVAWQASERYPFVLAANRDERHARPTARAAWWFDRKDVFGGRDLVELGSWLAIDRTGRLAAVTNLREADLTPTELSRGELVAGYLAAPHSIEAYLERLEPRREKYRPFSLLLFDRSALQYYSNRVPPATLGRGVHALSNAPLGSDWPKTGAARDGMRAALELTQAPTAALFDLLARRSTEPLAEQRYRSALFVEGTVYGTRSSTVIVVDADGELTFEERSFDETTRLVGEVRERIRLTPLAGRVRGTRR